MAMAETHKSYKLRVMSARLLVSLYKANNSHHIDIFNSLAIEILQDIDLEKEYQHNLIGNNTEEQEEHMDEE